MSWPTATIEEIASVKGGKRLPLSHDFLTDPTEHLYIRARDIGNNRITVTEAVYLTDDTFSKIKNYTVAANDLVVTIVGANIGDVGFITNEYDGANLTENAARIRVNEEVCDPRFLSFQLSTPRAKEKFQLLTGGSAQGKLGLYKINAVDIVLPPITVQSRIASILSAYDDLIENNRRRIQLLEQAARLLYKEWFVHLRFPGHEHTKIHNGIPDGWERKTLTNLAERVSYGFTASSSPEEIGPKFLRITDIVPPMLNWDEVPFCEATAEDIQRNKLETGDVVVARTGATVGYSKLISFLECPAVFASYLVRFRFPTLATSFIAGIFMESNAYKDYVKNHAGGAAQPNANAKVLGSAALLIPPKILQDQFSDSISVIFCQRDTLLRHNSRLSKARDLLLPRLMNGEVAV